MRDVTSDTPSKRALALISAPEDRLQECQRFLGDCIKEITSGKPPASQKKLRAQLPLASKHFWAALKALPRSRLRLLPPSFLKPANSIADLLDATRSKQMTLHRQMFLGKLEYIAINLEQQSQQLKVPRSGGRTDYRKQTAAEFALVLLAHYGRKHPTLTTGGPFLELASILYEAATGKRNVDLDRQCRTVHQQYFPRRDRSFRDRTT
jgi:hypothetical protein